jgi:hypothetical protein
MSVVGTICYIAAAGASCCSVATHCEHKLLRKKKEPRVGGEEEASEWE